MPTPEREWKTTELMGALQSGEILTVVEPGEYLVTFSFGKHQGLTEALLRPLSREERVGDDTT